MMKSNSFIRAAATRTTRWVADLAVWYVMFFIAGMVVFQGFGAMGIFAEIGGGNLTLMEVLQFEGGAFLMAAIVAVPVALVCNLIPFVGNWFCGE